MKEALVYIEQSIHEDQPIIYRVLHEAGNNLFFERNINPYTVAVYINPIAAGQILGLLDVLTGVHSNPKFMEFNDNIMNHEGMVEIFCRYIRRNGQIIYPRNARFFHFWVPADKARKYRA